jgi:hypothetical protein
MTDAVTVDAVTVGDHVCLTFSDPDERLDIVAEFVAEGLGCNHKVLCFTHSLTPQRLSDELTWRGVAVTPAVERGQLDVTGGEQLWAPSGSATAAPVLETLAGEIENASRQGYAGLRMTATATASTRSPWPSPRRRT